MGRRCKVRPGQSPLHSAPRKVDEIFDDETGNGNSAAVCLFVLCADKQYNGAAAVRWSVALEDMSFLIDGFAAVGACWPSPTGCHAHETGLQVSCGHSRE